jgi:hypothetical protein
MAWPFLVGGVICQVKELPEIGVLVAAVMVTGYDT